MGGLGSLGGLGLVWFGCGLGVVLVLGFGFGLGFGVWGAICGAPWRRRRCHVCVALYMCFVYAMYVLPYTVLYICCPTCALYMPRALEAKESSSAANARIQCARRLVRSSDSSWREASNSGGIWPISSNASDLITVVGGGGVMTLLMTCDVT